MKDEAVGRMPWIGTSPEQPEAGKNSFVLEALPAFPSVGRCIYHLIRQRLRLRSMGQAGVDDVNRPETGHPLQLRRSCSGDGQGDEHARVVGWQARVG